MFTKIVLAIYCVGQAVCQFNIVSAKNIEKNQNIVMAKYWGYLQAPGGGGALIFTSDIMCYVTK